WTPSTPCSRTPPRPPTWRGPCAASPARNSTWRTRSSTCATPAAPPSPSRRPGDQSAPPAGCSSRGSRWPSARASSAAAPGCACRSAPATRASTRATCPTTRRTCRNWRCRSSSATHSTACSTASTPRPTSTRWPTNTRCRRSPTAARAGWRRWPPPGAHERPSVALQLAEHPAGHACLVDATGDQRVGHEVDVVHALDDPRRARARPRDIDLPLAVLRALVAHQPELDGHPHRPLFRVRVLATRGRLEAPPAAGLHRRQAQHLPQALELAHAAPDAQVHLLGDGVAHASLAVDEQHQIDRALHAAARRRLRIGRRGESQREQPFAAFVLFRPGRALAQPADGGQRVAPEVGVADHHPEPAVA